MLNCRHFSGYKPCGKNEVCDVTCPHIAVARPRILIVHLEALGAVLRTTAILPALKRQFPQSHITWVTQAPAQELLKHNPFIDRLLTTSPDDLLSLRALSFDRAYCLDKSLKAAGILTLAPIKELFGFRVEAATGAIVPANSAAEELWQLGLSNQQKFFINQKTENQLAVEALELGPYQKDEYVLSLSEEEKYKAAQRRQEWLGEKLAVVGFNTGCAPIIPYKKWTVNYHREVITALLKSKPQLQVVLLGGKEDEARHREIAEGLPVICSPTQLGMRDGLCSIEACDVVVSGDSLGMHMAIGLKKWVVAWFGPTCAHEIELYSRGKKLLTQAKCSPCWKRFCDQPLMCYDQVPTAEVISAVLEGIEWKILSFKLPSLATLPLPSP